MGATPARAVLRDTGSTLVVRLTGLRPGAGGTGFFVQVGDGTRATELGLRFVDGEQTEAYTFGAPRGGTTVLLEAVVAGDTVTARFSHAAVGRVAENGVTGWTSSITRDDRTVGECTEALALLPFPG